MTDANHKQLLERVRGDIDVCILHLTATASPRHH